jgi:HSP20 family protein
MRNLQHRHFGGFYPYRHLATRESALNEAFAQLFENPWVSRSETAPEKLGARVHETSDGFVVSMDIPGVKKEDVHVQVADGLLTIRGERKIAQHWTDGEVKQASYGTFEQSFSLPSTAATERIEARIDSGVLSVLVPKTEKAKPREIPVLETNAADLPRARSAQKEASPH